MPWPWAGAEVVEDKDKDEDGWVRGQERLVTGMAGAMGGAAVVEEIR